VACFPSLDDWLDVEIRGWALADDVDDATLQRLKSDARKHLAPFADPGGRVAVPVTALVATASCG
jgi:hypothetical protein